jgi:hypothetical protein
LFINVAKDITQKLPARFRDLGILCVFGEKAVVVHGPFARLESSNRKF